MEPVHIIKIERNTDKFVIISRRCGNYIKLLHKKNHFSLAEAQAGQFKVHKNTYNILYKYIRYVYITIQTA